jgi:hypothetical protein
MKITERGTALLEAAGALGVLSLFLSGLLAVCYLLFARAWIQYQSEQALYCLSEGTRTSTCRSTLEKNLARFLPWGELKNVVVFEERDQWRVQLQWRTGWQWPNYAISVHKHLSTKMIAKNSKDLRS